MGAQQGEQGSECGVERGCLSLGLHAPKAPHLPHIALSPSDSPGAWR